MRTIKMTADTTLAFVSGEGAVQRVLNGEKKLYLKKTEQLLSFRELVEEGYLVLINRNILGVFDRESLDASVR